MKIIIKTEKEIELMRASGKILSDILHSVSLFIEENMSTMDIEIFIRKQLKKHNVRSPFLGYKNYPAVSCISINDELVHGIPSKDKVLRNGDIVSIDLGVIYKGYITDAARTFSIGNIDNETKRLIETTKRAFYEGAKYAIENNHLYDISAAIQEIVEKEQFSIVKDFVSHGVGRQLHEEPFFLNFGKRGTGPLLKYGMTFAIEPMVNQGNYEIIIDEDGWTARSKDGKKTAHYENTVLIGKDKCEILTE